MLSEKVCEIPQWLCHITQSLWCQWS